MKVVPPATIVSKRSVSLSTGTFSLGALKRMERISTLDISSHKTAKDILKIPKIWL
jgi:hypothetical protein